MTEVAIPGEIVDGEIADEAPAPAYPNPIIIEWPAESRMAGLPGWSVAITDAVTGEPITTVTGLDAPLHVDPEHLIAAVLTMLADEDGNPVPSGNTVYQRDGKILMGTFRAVVAEMRVRQPAMPEVPSQALPQPGQPGQ